MRPRLQRWLNELDDLLVVALSLCGLAYLAWAIGLPLLGLR